MPTLKCNSTFGNFKWSAVANVTDEQMVILASAGLLQVLQRSPASKAEKSLAGYEKRPEKFNRASIPFNTENADALSSELSKPVEIAEGITITPATTVSEHIIGESAQPKFVEEKLIINRHKKDGDLLDWARDRVKYTGEGPMDDTNVALLQAVKEYKNRILKDA